MNESEIRSLKDKLKKSGIHGLALDIDDTLAFTAGYWAEQLGQRFGNPEKLTVKEIMQKYNYIQNVQGWRSEEAIAWIEQARTSNEMQEILPLIENSNHFVNRINKIIPIACYITIRPEAVLGGTQKWLDKHGFPKAEIIARPKNLDYDRGTQWKARVLSELYPEVVGIVDDNPNIIDFLQDGYKGTLFVYERQVVYKGKLKLIPCSSWEEVLVKVKECYSNVIV